MDPSGIIRGLALFVPVLLLLLALRQRRPSGKCLAGALLATIWQLPALLLVHEVNLHASWWHFAAEGGLLHGMPVDLWLGWAVLWGALPAVALTRWPLTGVLAVMAAADALLMPLCAPVVQLHPNWWTGETFAVFVALLPGLLLSRWTAAGRHLTARVSLQFLAFAGLMLWVIPSIALSQSGGSWQIALDRPAWQQALFLGLAAFLAVPALSAVQEFCQRGHGTPLPLDPPLRLVTSGPYAYIANPMQTGMALLFLVWGAWSGSLWVTLVAAAAISTGTGIAGWSETRDLTSRFGIAWKEYRAQVPSWRPRLHPRVLVPARLYVAQSCGKCRALGAWIARHHPTSLEILPAEDHPSQKLTRLTYEAPAWRATGTRALARALEHLHLGWAWLGWIIRLPLLATFIQTLTDLCGGGPLQLSAPPPARQKKSHTS